MIKVGDTLPNVTLKKMTDSGIEDVPTGDFFAGRKVVLFAVPGAFTPTCAQQHLPDYVTRAQDFFDRGVDEIACMAVNDPFVLSAWGKSASVDGQVTLLSDGNAELATAMGLTFDGSQAGLGTRAKRFAAVIENGKVTALEVEDNPGVMNVSSAAHLLEVIDQG